MILKTGETMNLPDDTHLAYIVSHEAWYYRGDGKPSLSVSASANGGGVAWEFEIEEMELGGKPVTRVKVFDDAYAAFAQVPELFAALADGAGTTLTACRGLLDMLGAADETGRTGPRGEAPRVVRGPHDAAIREALRLAQSSAPNASAYLRFADALAAMGGAGTETSPA
jgi:hypothetical protein